MRIAIDISPVKSRYRQQGTGNYVKHLVDGLKQEKNDNEYIFYEGRSPESSRWISGLVHGRKLPKNADLVHIPYFSPYERTLSLFKTKAKLVATIHDLNPVIFYEHFPPGNRGYLTWLLQRYLLKRNVSDIIVDSEAVKNDIGNHADFSEEHISVVYLAADKKFRPLETDQRELHHERRDKYNLPEKFVLYVGDILWNKNIPSLIEAAQKINVTLVIVGKQAASKEVDKNHPWNRDLAKVQKIAQKDERIKTLGYVPDEDLIKLYNLASVYCQPSHYEGFGLPVLEAMACGCPVVVSDRGGLPEIVQDAGIYVDPADTRSIADGIGEIYFNPQNYKKYRELGLEQAKKFSWKKTISETIKVYERVLS